MFQFPYISLSNPLIAAALYSHKPNKISRNLGKKLGFPLQYSFLRVLIISISYMKRTIIERDSLSMADCLTLLSHRKEYYYDAKLVEDDSVPNKVFECKTCNRQFSSFQALGGHRASHKKPKLTTTRGDENLHASSSSSPLKPKTHECSICGLEFAIGQALGGHMRRHRASASAAMNDSNTTLSTTAPPLNLFPPHHPIHQVPVVKKSNSTRVFCLDLNLTPMENILEFRLGKPLVKPVINCYL